MQADYGLFHHVIIDIINIAKPVAVASPDWLKQVLPLEPPSESRSLFVSDRRQMRDLEATVRINLTNQTLLDPLLAEA